MTTVLRVLCGVALSFLCFSFHHNSKPALADPVTVSTFVGAALIAAFSVLVCATAAPGTSISGYGGEFSGGGGETFFDKSETYTILSEGVVDSSGDIVYRNNVNMLTQLGALAKSFQSAFDKGELVFEDNNYVIKGKELHSLIEQANQAIGVMARPKVDFTAGYNFTFLDVDLSKPIALKSLPTISLYVDSFVGQSYASVYFDDNRVVFSPYYFNLSIFDSNPDSVTMWVGIDQLNDKYKNTRLVNSSYNSAGGKLDDHYKTRNYFFTFQSLSHISWSYMWYNQVRATPHKLLTRRTENGKINI